MIRAQSGGSGGLTSVATENIDDDAVTYAKIQNVSATDKVLGRATSGAGDVEEIACTSAGRALLDDADNSAQRTTLGLGTIATQNANNVTISGGAISGITDLAVADGGTGASTAAAARANLGIVDYFLVALSDSATVITTGTGKETVRFPAAFTISAVRAQLATASTSGVVTVDINKNGSTILSTKLTIDANEKTSVTAATPAVLSATAIADDDELTFDIDTAGANAVGLKVTLIGSWN